MESTVEFIVTVLTLVIVSVFALAFVIWALEVLPKLTA